LTEAEAGSDGEQEPPSQSRRDFLKVAATISASLALLGVASVVKTLVIPPVSGSAQGFPRVKVANTNELLPNAVVLFNYPLDNEPNFLVKVGRKSVGGVGPDQDIVAFSSTCQHLGSVYAYIPPGSSPHCRSSYVASGPVGFCCTHGSIYDYSEGGKVIGGPSPRPQPQVVLEVDSAGNIYAVGMGPPSVFGHNTGSSNPNDDLQGGTLVTST
jgi:arsenite oxidase small subunit